MSSSLFSTFASMMQLYLIKVSPCIQTGQPAPPGSEADIPFRVARTKSRNLPVYLDYKNGRTRVLTLIRKIDGNVVVSLIPSVTVYKQQTLREEHLGTKGTSLGSGAPLLV